MKRRTALKGVVALAATLAAAAGVEMDARAETLHFGPELHAMHSPDPSRLSPPFGVSGPVMGIGGQPGVVMTEFSARMKALWENYYAPIQTSKSGVEWTARAATPADLRVGHLGPAVDPAKVGSELQLGVNYRMDAEGKITLLGANLVSPEPRSQICSSSREDEGGGITVLRSAFLPLNADADAVAAAVHPDATRVCFLTGNEGGGVMASETPIEVDACEIGAIRKVNYYYTRDGEEYWRRVTTIGGDSVWDDMRRADRDALAKAEYETEA